MTNIERLATHFQTNEQLYTFLGIDKATLHRWQSGDVLPTGAALRLITVLDILSDEAPHIFNALVEQAREQAPTRIRARKAPDELARDAVERAARKVERDAARDARRAAKKLRKAGGEDLRPRKVQPVKVAPKWDDAYWHDRTMGDENDKPIIDPPSFYRAMTEDEERTYWNLCSDYLRRTGRFWPDHN